MPREWGKEREALGLEGHVLGGEGEEQTSRRAQEGSVCRWLFACLPATSASSGRTFGGGSIITLRTMTMFVPGAGG
jgi:hypothetical protein